MFGGNGFSLPADYSPLLGDRLITSELTEEKVLHSSFQAEA